MPPRSLKLPSGYSIAVSESERLVAAIGRNVVVGDLDNGRRVFSVHPFAHPSYATFSTDESRLAVKSTSGSIAILCAQSGAVNCLYKPKGHDEGGEPLFSADGAFLVDSSWDGVISVKRTDTLTSERSFKFVDEQIGSASASAKRDKWLFKHTPRSSTAGRLGLPFLSLWSWPLVEAEAKITPGFDIIYAAALAPTASQIAVVGYDRQSERRELRVIGLDGALISSKAVSGGGTGSSTRWSRDSTMIGTIGDKFYHVFSAPELQDVASIPDEYPSDLSFLAHGDKVVLGSWSKTVQVPMPKREA